MTIILWGKTVVAYNSQADRDSIIPSLIESKQIIAQDFDKVEIKTTPLKNNIYMLQGEGGNIAVSVGKDGILMIDSEYAPLSTKIMAAIEKISDQPIRYLVNTHYHSDHTGGNENFAKAGALIIAHENVPKQMKIAHSFPILSLEMPVAPTDALPKITFDDTINFNVNDHQIHGFRVAPAHTDGDIILHFVNENIVHTGDLFFNGIYPFIDIGVGGSVQGMISGIDKILPLCNDETLIIPGHGPLGNKKELITFQEMLKTVNQRVKDGIAKNMTLDDLIKAKTIDDLQETWGKGFFNSDQFLTITYQGLTKN
ncbi:cyclase [Geminocystis sp. NIES-3709]|nr:cyclase [Geminocystis sp. NIES-3709]